MTRFTRHIRRFARRENGAILVEFGMALPVLILFLAVIIEGGRMTWIYQSAAAGVRDATRMLARMAPPDICTSGSIATYDAAVTQIVTDTINGASALPNLATVLDVSPTLTCVTGTFRVSPAPIVEVRARVQMDYIFGNVFGLFGSSLGPLITEVADQSKVYGI